MYPNYRKGGQRVVQPAGILIHGTTDLIAPRWFDCKLGDPATQRRGQLATAIFAAANVGPENVRAIVVGNGISVPHRDGKAEAVATQELFLDAFYDTINDVDVLAKHPGLRDLEARHALYRLFVDAICDVESKAAAQEVRRAAKIFAENDIRHVFQVIDMGLESDYDPTIPAEREAVPQNQLWVIAPTTV